MIRYGWDRVAGSNQPRKSNRKNKTERVGNGALNEKFS